MSKLFLSFLFFTLLINSSWAGNWKILEVTNDQDSDLTTLTVIEKAGQLRYLHIKTISAGKVITDRKHDVEAAKSGIVLFSSGNHEVIRLRLSDRFEPLYGGGIILDHLLNGVTGSRRTIALDITREQESWFVQRNENKVVRAHVVSNRILGKVIGVKDIRF
jgi:hypothetical protein